MSDRTYEVTPDQLRALLAERVRLARSVIRDSPIQEGIDRLCEQCMEAGEIELGFGLSLLNNFRVMHATSAALRALFQLHADIAPRALRGADPN